MVVVPPRGRSLTRVITDLRAYVDALQIDGHTLGEGHDDDPILLETVEPKCSRSR